jgi:hypothetical protein
MKPLRCGTARRRLQAYYDGELSVAEQQAVSAHVDACVECTAALAELERVGSALRELAPGRWPAAALSCDEAAAFSATVVNRARVEREASLVARVQGVFEDMHLVYIGLSAVGASLACILVMLGMMRFGVSPGPGSNSNPVVVDARMMMPRALASGPSSPGTENLMYLGSQDDGVVAFSAVVTREGRVADLELLDAPGRSDLEGLLDAVSQARFEPARKEGWPVAVNMVWLVANTTVRAAEPQNAAPGPVLRKRLSSRAGAGPTGFST